MTGSVLFAAIGNIEATFGLTLDIVSGGNSANLNWALSGADTGRINDLRLGESILLGREPLHRQPIEGLYTDAITNPPRSAARVKNAAVVECVAGVDVIDLRPAAQRGSFTTTNGDR